MKAFSAVNTKVPHTFDRGR